MKTITIQIDEELLEAIDHERGDVPRQRWIARVCEERLSTGRGGPTFPSTGTASTGSPVKVDSTGLEVTTTSSATTGGPVDSDSTGASPKGKTKTSRPKTKAASTPKDKGLCKTHGAMLLPGRARCARHDCKG